MPNLAKYSYGWSALEQHHKIGILSCTSVVWVSIYQAYTWLVPVQWKIGLGPNTRTRQTGMKVPNISTMKKQKQTRGVCHIVALLFTLKSILRQNKNHWNSNISPSTYIIFKKSSKRNQNPPRYYNSISTNLKFQYKPKYPLSKILV